LAFRTLTGCVASLAPGIAPSFAISRQCTRGPARTPTMRASSNLSGNYLWPAARSVRSGHATTSASSWAARPP
jgi:hypothetical protein